MSKRSWLIISVLVDALLINTAIILAFLIRFGGKLPPFNFQAYTNLAVFITLIQLIVLYLYDLYEPEKIESRGDTFFAILKAVTLGIVLVTTLTFIARFFSFPRTVLILSWFLLLLILSGWRIFSPKVLRIKFPLQKVLLVGTGETSQEILNELKKRSRIGYEVVGLVERDPLRIGGEFKGFSVLGKIRDIPALIKKYRINRIIVTTPVRQRELIESLIESQESEVKVEVVPELYEIFVGKFDHTLVKDVPLMELTKEPVSNWVYLSKRIFDLVLALILLAITLPLLVLIAILIKITSKGPLFYRQERVGKAEKIFKIFKFRTMAVGAEEKTGPILAKEFDSRITWIGRSLRRYRIDEFPQLLNILKGEMSFVGPRPERPTFVAKFKKEIPGYSERFRMKPGLTGLAQVSGYYVTTPQNKLKYDLIYLYHQSIPLDLRILFKTLKVVLTGRGAS